MKQWFLKKNNIFTLLVLAYLIYQKGPVVVKNFRSEGTPLETKEYVALNSTTNDMVKFPPPGSRSLAIFWATWCGPCKIEMERLKTSVDKGKIPGDKIFAINPFEAEEVSREFARKNDFPFIFIDASDISRRLKVELTPTTILIDNGRVESMSSGLSLLGIWKAELYL